MQRCHLPHKHLLALYDLDSLRRIFHLAALQVVNSFHLLAFFIHLTDAGLNICNIYAKKVTIIGSVALGVAPSVKSARGEDNQRPVGGAVAALANNVVCTFHATTVYAPVAICGIVCIKRSTLKVSFIFNRNSFASMGDSVSPIIPVPAVGHSFCKG